MGLNQKQKMAPHFTLIHYSQSYAYLRIL